MTVPFELDRRDFLAGSVALAIPATAQAPASSRPSDDLLRTIARRELDRAGKLIWIKDMVGIVDFSLPSFEPRFFLVDMVSGKVRSFLLAHGVGSDPDHDGYLKTFSNEPNSKATSRGSFITHDWYDGKHGTSLRLTGLDPDNSNADDRAIVVHGAWYANRDMIKKWGKLGRSEGCFAVSEGKLMEVIARLGPGRLLFADKISPSLPRSPLAAPVTSPVAAP
jgi:L,D-transpeptidase catalytic domain